MKALIYEKAHTLDNFALGLTEVAEPTLRDSDVLVEVRAVGINPGEAFIRKSRNAEAGGHVLLGWEFAGVVIGLGAAVLGFKIGDRVFGTGDMTRDGCWAERLAVDYRILAIMPDRLSFADAASLPVGSITAWEALFREDNALPIDVNRVLVVGGAGGVGSLATQLLKAKTRAFVISTASRPDSKAWCAKMGADLVIDHSGDVIAQLAAANIPSVDMVLSTAKTADNIGWIARLLRPFGHLSVVDGSPVLDASALMPKAASLHTEMIFSKILHGYAVDSQGTILESVADFVAEGQIQSIATTRLNGLTPESMKTAHGLVETRRMIGKVVIAFV